MQTSNTSIIRTPNRSLAVEWEKYWCSAVGMAVLVVFGVFAKHWLGIADANHWHLDNLYSAVFGLATFVSGFLFAIYAYVKTTENRILEAIRHSIYFDRASHYMIVAMTMAAILSVVTIPFFVVVPDIKDRHVTYWMFCAWAAFTSYVGCSTIRSVRHFIVILNNSSPRKARGGTTRLGKG